LMIQMKISFIWLWNIWKEGLFNLNAFCKVLMRWWFWMNWRMILAIDSCQLSNAVITSVNLRWDSIIVIICDFKFKCIIALVLFTVISSLIIY
jgi:hypothetical protein